MISIFTATVGREFYLQNLIDSIDKKWQDKSQFHHHIWVMGYKPFLKIPYSNVTVHYKEQVSSIGAALREFVNTVDSTSHIMKLDDDALLVSDGFGDVVSDLISINPNAVFSAYPVGLINNPGGPPKISHEVVESKILNKFYTMRRVPHVGGFCRVSPWSVVENARITDSHNEDSEVSSYCNQNSIGMFYLENSLIVEHQESTLGQHARYGKEYFGARF